jgi:oxygen-independent coproporphyrinogen-3 oxidase
MNAYLHIPFCASICPYCDFTSVAGQESRIESYVSAMTREISTSDLEGPLRTVYFGGGTPSSLSPSELGRILKVLKEKAEFSSEVEISLEANPETVDTEKLRGYFEVGVNRVSFGAQTSQKELLKKLGRGHEWPRVVQAAREARQAGFRNINLDLMFGLSGQTLEMFKESLGLALELAPEHFSIYSLQVEEGTPLDRWVKEGLALPAENLVADQYEAAQETLRKAGYVQYEVSNFAKNGLECRHNWNIWRGEDYWGFGVSAVGTVRGSRFTHGENLMDYIQKAGRDFSQEKEEINPEIRLLERIMLGLRTKEGVEENLVFEYEKLRKDKVSNPWGPMVSGGFLTLSQGRYQPTSKGYFVLNGILERLLF